MRPTIFALRHPLQAYLKTLWLILLSCSWANAQTRSNIDYEIRRLTVREGIVNHTISAFCMDGGGTLWIGTHSGLYTFDGFRLDRFDVQNLSHRQLPAAPIVGLETDTTGQNLVFVCTLQGVLAVDPIEHRVVPDTALGLPAGFLQTCTQIKKSIGGFYWLLCGQALYKLTKIASKRYRCQWITALPVHGTSTLQAAPSDPEGLWILPPGMGGYYLNAKGLEHYPFTGNKAATNQKKGLVQCVYTKKGIFGWDLARNIYHLNTGLKQVDLVTNQYNLYDLLPALESVDNFLEQKPMLNCCATILAGQQLFGTNQGLFIVQKKIPKFLTINALRGEEIRGIHTDTSGKWWAGSYNGLFTGHLLHTQVQRAGIRGVWDFLPIADNVCLLAVEKPKGIFEWDMELNKLVSDKSALLSQLEEQAIDELTCLTLCKDKQGTIWVGTYSHLLFASATQPFQFHFWEDASTGKPMGVRFVRAILADNNSGIWVGSEDGLLRIVYNAQQKRYETDATAPNLKGAFISDLYRDMHDRLWIATKGKGIAVLDLKNLKTPPQWYNSEDGLCNDMTCRIEGSNYDEVLWISTHNGLSRFDLKANAFHNFYEDSGFPGNEFNSAASARFPDGTLLFGGVSGMIRFHPDSVPAVDFKHKTILSGASYYDKASKQLSTLSPSLLRGLSLPPYPEYFELLLGSTEFVTPEKVRFRYRLKGLSDLWTYISGEGEVKFIRLPPGNYVFEAQAILIDGHFSQPVMLPIFVATPIYETWWFKTFLVALSLGIGYLAYLYRVRRILREQLIRQQIADDLHDDIGNKLNIISMVAQKIAKNQPENGRLTPELNNLIETSRNALRSLHTMIWSVDSKKDRLSSLFDRMQDFADSYLRPLHITFKFDLKVPASNRYINLKVRHHIIMIYQEVLTNMVKFARPSLIIITVKLEADVIHMHIVNQLQQFDDHGISAVSANRGLSSIERRLNRINGKYTWTERSADRQEITLVVPQIFKRS